jgi:hypothetical protein
VLNIKVQLVQIEKAKGEQEDGQISYFNGKKYKLIYVKSSRLSCILQKEKDDEIKL